MRRFDSDSRLSLSLKHLRRQCSSDVACVAVLVLLFIGFQAGVLTALLVVHLWIRAQSVEVIFLIVLAWLSGFVVSGLIVRRGGYVAR